MEPDIPPDASRTEQVDPRPRGTVRERLAAAGIPVPAPMTEQQRAEWEQQLKEVAEETPRFWAERRAS